MNYNHDNSICDQKMCVSVMQWSVQVLHRGPNGSTSPGAVANHSPLSPPKSSPYPATGDEPDEQMDNGKEEEKVTSDEETKKLTFEIEQLKLALATR